VGNIANGVVNIELPLSGLEQYYNDAQNVYPPVIPHNGINIIMTGFKTDKNWLSLANYDTYDTISFIYADKAGSFEWSKKTIKVEEGWNFYSSKTGACDTLENYYLQGYVWTFEMFQ
jgi:hypothetical protein